MYFSPSRGDHGTHARNSHREDPQKQGNEKRDFVGRLPKKQGQKPKEENQKDSTQYAAKQAAALMKSSRAKAPRQCREKQGKNACGKGQGGGIGGEQTKPCSQGAEEAGKPDANACPYGGVS